MFWGGGCHALDTEMPPRRMSCGFGGDGLACHTTTPTEPWSGPHLHGRLRLCTDALTASAASPVARTPATPATACSQRPRAVFEYHRGLDRRLQQLNDVCHGSPSMTQELKATGQRQRLHALPRPDRYLHGALDRHAVGLERLDGATTTRPRTPRRPISGPVSSGGTVSASCDVCHDLGMRAAHGASPAAASPRPTRAPT